MKKNRKNQSYKNVDAVEVYMWGKYVGATALDPRLGFYVFAYDSTFAKSGIQPAPLHMPLRSDQQVFVFTDLPEHTYLRLPAMLADALPDDFGNALIDSYLASKGINKAQITPLDRLAYMGQRAMGALEFKPVRGPRTKKPTALILSELVRTARNAVHGTLKYDLQTQAALRSIIDVGTSAGGARAKAVIAWNRDTDQICSGQVDTPTGFEHWLLKFDGMGKDRELGSSEDHGRIEFAYYLMAKEAGIHISDSRLLEENGRAHFMTKRFDRTTGNVKIHMQTLCAMDHIDYKKKSTNSYEQLFMTIHRMGFDHDAYVEVFRRMVFNVMARNCDDHTKNFAFLLREGSAWELAPAYDLTFAHNPKGEWTNQHLMSVNGKFRDITINDIFTVADRFGVGEAKVIISTVRNAIKGWDKAAKSAGVAAAERTRIKKMHLLLDFK